MTLWDEEAAVPVAYTSGLLYDVVPVQAQWSRARLIGC
ncbi:hypothetical protein FHR38_001207 [Micromonospora polyrhachis]|uniref:Uncharacterized protein n=1 Tax=Micromonospora polyrhachis TaxID=1282883 RepID=A0A7W7SMI4_9ACTN|nr:hypothetical protein [Micromonospora polyrhachis]